jgi:hypothetical protein
MRVAVLGCLLGALIPDQASTPSRPSRDPECFRPLEEFCASESCPTYAVQIARMRDGGSCYGTVGRCGKYQITHRGDGFTSETRYFDKSGRLVAARTGSDCLRDNRTCPDWNHYGAVITCRVTNVKQLCNPQNGSR